MEFGLVRGGAELDLGGPDALLLGLREGAALGTRCKNKRPPPTTKPRPQHTGVTGTRDDYHIMERQARPRRSRDHFKWKEFRLFKWKEFRLTCVAVEGPCARFKGALVPGSPMAGGGRWATGKEEEERRLRPRCSDR